MKFPILPLKRFQKNIDYQNPIQKGVFSFDKNRNLTFDYSFLKYELKEIPLNLDLSEGFEECVNKDEVPSSLESVVKCLEFNQVTIPDRSLITWRGLLTKLVCTPYDKSEWKLQMFKYNNVYYLQEPLDLKDDSIIDEKSKMMMYWGRKFENIAVGSTKNVDTNEEFAVVAYTKLGNQRIFIGAEVDAVQSGISKITLDTCNLNAEDYKLSDYVEFKTTKVIQNDRDRHNFERFKLLKFWAQSYLIGIPKITVGYRDILGLIKDVGCLNVCSIPSLVRNSSSFWDPNVGLNFASLLLSTVMDNLEEEEIFEFSFSSPFEFVEGKSISNSFFDYLKV